MRPRCHHNAVGEAVEEKEKEVGIERTEGKTKLVCSSRLQSTAAAETEAASPVPVAICRSCHLTLLATSWNIQQASSAQVPPNGCPPYLPSSSLSYGWLQHSALCLIWYAFLFASYTNGARPNCGKVGGCGRQTQLKWTEGTVELSLELPILIMVVPLCVPLFDLLFSCLFVLLREFYVRSGERYYWWQF